MHPHPPPVSARPSSLASSPSLAPRLAQLAQQISDESQFVVLDATAEILAIVVDLAPVVRWATFTQQPAPAAGLRTTAASGPIGTQLDVLQHECGEGPCLDALATSEVVVTDDLAQEARWPRFASRAVERTPARAVFSFPMVTAGRPGVTLNLYADETAAFAGSAEQAAVLTVAAGAGLAMAAIAQRQRADHLALAMVSNRDIGAAIGMLMNVHRWTSDEAFIALRRRSQSEHRKLRQIADDVLASGDLPKPLHPPDQPDRRKNPDQPRRGGSGS